MLPNLLVSGFLRKFDPEWRTLRDILHVRLLERLLSTLVDPRLWSGDLHEIQDLSRSQ
jgi:hypothetical protein